MKFEIDDTVFFEITSDMQQVTLRMIANLMAMEMVEASQVHHDFCLDLKTNIKDKGIEAKLTVVLNFVPGENLERDKFRLSLISIEEGTILTVEGELQNSVPRNYTTELNQ